MDEVSSKTGSGGPLKEYANSTGCIIVVLSNTFSNIKICLLIGQVIFSYHRRSKELEMLPQRLFIYSFIFEEACGTNDSTFFNSNHRRQAVNPSPENCLRSKLMAISSVSNTGLNLNRQKKWHF